MRRLLSLSITLLFVVRAAGYSSADDLAKEIDAALARAGGNRAEIQAALDKAPADEREGMQFVVAYMPERDLTTLKSAFLLENVHLAYRAFSESPWKKDVPH